MGDVWTKFGAALNAIQSRNANVRRRVCDCNGCDLGFGYCTKNEKQESLAGLCFVDLFRYVDALFYRSGVVGTLCLYNLLLRQKWPPESRILGLSAGGRLVLAVDSVFLETERFSATGLLDSASIIYYADEFRDGIVDIS